MTCDEIQNSIDAYIDGELDVLQARNIERHVDDCVQCCARIETHRALSRVVGKAPYFFAPTDLKDRIGAAVGGAREKSRRIYLAIAASLTIGLALGVLLSLVALPGAPRDRLVQQVVTAHVRSLMLNSHTIDVVSSDEHTVKPWFIGKLDFTPMVMDFADAGFPLLGGRVDYLQDRTVAALVYRHRRHLINVFCWPARASATTRAESVRGYNLAAFVAGGLQYWLISDLNRADLDTFSRRLESEAGKAEFSDNHD